MEKHQTQRKGLRKHNTHSVLRQHLSLLLNGETPETFPLKTEDTDAHFTTTNIVLEGLASETGQNIITPMRASTMSFLTW